MNKSAFLLGPQNLELGLSGVFNSLMPIFFFVLIVALFPTSAVLSLSSSSSSPYSSSLVSSFSDIVIDVSIIDSAVVLVLFETLIVRMEADSIHPASFKWTPVIIPLPCHYGSRIYGLSRYNFIVVCDEAVYVVSNGTTTNLISFPTVSQAAIRSVCFISTEMMSIVYQTQLNISIYMIMSSSLSWANSTVTVLVIPDGGLYGQVMSHSILHSSPDDVLILYRSQLVSHTRNSSSRDWVSSVISSASCASPFSFSVLPISSTGRSQLLFIGCASSLLVLKRDSSATPWVNASVTMLLTSSACPFYIQSSSPITVVALSLCNAYAGGTADPLVYILSEQATIKQVVAIGSYRDYISTSGVPVIAFNRAVTQIYVVQFETFLILYSARQQLGAWLLNTVNDGEAESNGETFPGPFSIVSLNAMFFSTRALGNPRRNSLLQFQRLGSNDVDYSDENPSTVWVSNDIPKSCRIVSTPMFVTHLEMGIECSDSNIYLYVRPSISTPWSDASVVITPLTFNITSDERLLYLNPLSPIVLTAPDSVDDDRLIVYERSPLFIMPPLVPLFNRTVLSNLTGGSCNRPDTVFVLGASTIYVECATGLLQYSRSSPSSLWSTAVVDVVVNDVVNACADMSYVSIVSAVEVYMLCFFVLAGSQAVSIHRSTSVPWSSATFDVLNVPSGLVCSATALAVTSSLSVYVTCSVTGLLHFSRASADVAWSSASVTNIMSMTSQSCSSPGALTASPLSSALSPQSSFDPVTHVISLMLTCNRSSIVELSLHCTVGWFANASTGACDCPAGFACPAIDVAPVPCVAGSYSACPAGAKSCDALLSCEQCEKGKYQAEYKQTSCMSCASGAYANTTGQTSCSLCTAGSECEDATVNPELCAPGTFSMCNPLITQGRCLISECTPCVLGSYQSFRGSTSCLLCPAGSYCSSIGPSPCEPGTASQCAEYASACYTPSSSQGVSAHCPLCPLKTYMPHSGASSCLTCPQNMNSLGSSACIPVPDSSSSSSSSLSLASLSLVILGPFFAGLVGIFFWFLQQRRERALHRQQFVFARAIYMRMRLTACDDFTTMHGMRLVKFIQVLQQALDKQCQRKQRQQEQQAHEQQQLQQQSDHHHHQEQSLHPKQADSNDSSSSLVVANAAADFSLPIDSSLHSAGGVVSHSSQCTPYAHPELLTVSELAMLAAATESALIEHGFEPVYSSELMRTIHDDDDEPERGHCGLKRACGPSCRLARRACMRSWCCNWLCPCSRLRTRDCCDGRLLDLTRQSLPLTDLIAQRIIGTININHATNISPTTSTTGMTAATTTSKRSFDTIVNEHDHDEYKLMEKDMISDIRIG